MEGCGIIRILSECKKNGFEMPKWIDNNNILLLTFPGVSYGINEGVNINIEGVNEGAKKVLAKDIFVLRQKYIIKNY